MSKLAFTLIELIIVVLIISILSFLVIKLPTVVTRKPKIEYLRNYLYPNGVFYLLDNGEEIVTKEQNTTLNINFITPQVYRYNGKEFKRVEFGYLNNRKIIFKYKVKDGIGDSFILKNGETYYVFKPFFIKKYNTFEKAKNSFLLINYLPKKGNYY